MSKVTHALAFTAGCVVGVFALALVYADQYFRTCVNTDPDGFECSFCESHTDYHPDVPFRFCPICGSAVMQREKI